MAKSIDIDRVPLLLVVHAIIAFNVVVYLFMIIHFCADALIYTTFGYTRAIKYSILFCTVSYRH